MNTEVRINPCVMRFGVSLEAYMYEAKSIVEEIYKLYDAQKALRVRYAAARNRLVHLNTYFIKANIMEMERLEKQIAEQAYNLRTIKVSDLAASVSLYQAVMEKNRVLVAEADGTLFPREATPFKLLLDEYKVERDQLNDILTTLFARLKIRIGDYRSLVETHRYKAFPYDELERNFRNLIYN